MDIGKRIRELRKEHGLTITDLANRSDLTRNAVSRIELGHRKPSSTTVEKLAGGLGVEPGDLYPQEGVKKAQEAIKEALNQVGVEVRYLTLSGDELLALYSATTSIEEAEGITEGLLSEWRALDENPSGAPIPGEPTRAYFVTRLAALRGLGEVVAREVETAARLDEAERQARLEDVQAAYDRVTQEVNKELAGAGAL